MSLVTITRMKVWQLSRINATLRTDASVPDVIAGLQGDYASNLNTYCPTCRVNDVPTGFLNIGDTTHKMPCTTCHGYLLINSRSGDVTPPTNPFGIPVPKYLLPADFQQAVLGFPSATVLSTLITALQGNYNNPKPSNSCPQCSGSGVFTTTMATKTVCPLCAGLGSTVPVYTYSGGRAHLVVTPVTPPDPLPVPPTS